MQRRRIAAPPLQLGPLTKEQFEEMRKYSVSIGIPVAFYHSIFKFLKIIFAKEITGSSEDDFVYLMEERMLEAKGRNTEKKQRQLEKYSRPSKLVSSVHEFYNLTSEQRKKLFRDVYNHMLSIPKKELINKL